MDCEWKRICGKRIRSGLNRAGADFFDEVDEIRLRVGKPVTVTMESGNHYLTETGEITGKWEMAVIVTEEDMAETMEYVSSYSRYAFAEELRRGFITIRGGHRVGVCGKAVTGEDGKRGIQYITGLNIRVARQVPGCSDAVFPWLYPEGQPGHVLLASPPGCGKTTLLRDLVRRLSDGEEDRPGYRVSLVDERSEIAACHRGVPQNDVGRNTDVLDSCPKAEGMTWMIRSMNPQVLAVDEIGTAEDIAALRQAVTCGCSILATIHAGSLPELRGKAGVGDLLAEGLFAHILLMGRGSQGRVWWKIFGEDGREEAEGWR